MLNDKSGIPKYIQISEDLKNTVKKFKEKGYEKFLGDEELAKKYGVSRMTIRQAIQTLVDERILIRVQGKGTYIDNYNKLETDIAKLNSFFRGWYLSDKFTVELLFKGTVPCPRDIAMKLNIQTGENVYQVKRLRKSNDKPIVIDNRYLKVEYGEKVTEEEYISYSFSHIFLKKFDWTFSEGEIELEAILADEERAEILDVKVGDPILYRDVSLKMKELGTVLAGSSHYRGDMYKYKSIIKAD